MQPERKSVGRRRGKNPFQLNENALRCHHRRAFPAMLRSEPIEDQFIIHIGLFRGASKRYGESTHDREVAVFDVRLGFGVI